MEGPPGRSKSGFSGSINRFDFPIYLETAVFVFHMNIVT